MKSMKVKLNKLLEIYNLNKANLKNYKNFEGEILQLIKEINPE
jgi:hypothetical protein